MWRWTVHGLRVDNRFVALSIRAVYCSFKQRGKLLDAARLPSRQPRPPHIMSRICFKRVFDKSVISELRLPPFTKEPIMSETGKSEISHYP